MKKFIVKYKDTNKTFGEYTSKEEASDKVMEYINGQIGRASCRERV